MSRIEFAKRAVTTLIGVITLPKSSLKLQDNRRLRSSDICSSKGTPDAPDARKRQDLLHRNADDRHRALRRFLREGLWLECPAARQRQCRLRRYDRPSQRELGAGTSAVVKSRPALLHHGRQRRC